MAVDSCFRGLSWIRLVVSQRKFGDFTVAVNWLESLALNV